MNFEVIDTKHPKRDPFMIGQAGMDVINRGEPGRLVRAEKLQIHKLPELVVLKPIKTIHTKPEVTISESFTDQSKGRKPAKQRKRR